MSELHPSILNAMRRRELDKNPERNIIPAMRRRESEPVAELPETPRRLGRLASLAGNIRLIAPSPPTNETEEKTDE